MSAVVACAVPSGGSETAKPRPSSRSTPSPSELARYRDLLAAARREGSVLVIVELAIPYRPEAELDDPEAVQKQRADIARAQDELLASLEGNDVTVAARYERLPQIALGVDEAALRVLLGSHLVEGIQLNRPEPPAAP